MRRAGLVRRHSTTSRCCVGFDARPERGTAKERRSAAPEDRRGIAKGRHERRARQRARPGSRGVAAGGERATSLVAAASARPTSPAAAK